MTTNTSTATMRAFAFDEFGAPGAGTIRTVPTPAASEGEILVRVYATGVNPMDLGVISGYAKDMMEHRFPLIPGVDAAGVVDQIGPGVTQFAPGDEVFGRSPGGEYSHPGVLSLSSVFSTHSGHYAQPIGCLPSLPCWCQVTR